MKTRDHFMKGAVDTAARGVHAGSDLVEGIHRAVSGTVRRHNPLAGRIPSISTGVYSAIRGVTSVVAMAGVQAMGWASRLPGEAPGPEQPLSPWQLNWVSGFNAAWGDFFAEEEHPWALPMGFSDAAGASSFSTGLPDWVGESPSPHLVLFLHGLGMNELAWRDRNGQAYTDALAGALGAQPIMLRYNTGLPIHENGARLAEKLEMLLHQYPVPVASLTLVGHSMGGLVALAAGHHGQSGGYVWPQRLRGVACIGSPHQGASLEVLGNWFTHFLSRTRYSAPLALIGQRRSAGIKDLRHGSLRSEDWVGRDRDQVSRFHPHSVKMVPGTKYLMVGASTGRRAALQKTIGDGLVTPDSALSPRFEVFDETRVRRERLQGIHHLALLTHPAVGELLVEWATTELSVSQQS